jgi:hypothetical protein
MPDRLDFDSARRVLEQIAPTDTWDEATLRAASGSLVHLDAEDATASTRRRRPRRPRPPTIGLIAIAACLVAVVGLVAVVRADRQSVDTVPPAQSPTSDCPNTTQPRAITQGAQMNKRFAAPIASAATALLLLGACGDDDDSSSAATDAAADGPTTLAKGEDIELVGGMESGLGNQNLDIDAVEENGEVTGEFRVTDQSGTQPPNVFTVECARTDPEDDVVILGGSANDEGLDWNGGFMMALIIVEGDPDSVALYPNESATSCNELLDSIPEDPVTGHESGFVDVEDGSDIETG